MMVKQSRDGNESPFKIMRGSSYIESFKESQQAAFLLLWPLPLK